MADERHTWHCEKCRAPIVEHTLSHLGSSLLTFEFVNGLPPRKMLLCLNCVVAVGEMLSPDIARRPGYVADKDQAEALMRQYGDTDIHDLP